MYLYSSPTILTFLGNGPGYSLIIMPFVALKLPLISIKLMNAIFYYFSIILLFKSLQRIVTFNYALIFSLLWALYPNTFEQLPYVLPEVFASSLIPLLLFSVILAFNKGKTKKTYIHIIVAGLTLGYLGLTKPIFGYVLVFMILGTIFLLIINRANLNYKKIILILTIAFVTTTPWLAYTYRMTGKLLYWSSFGGNNLYWMSTPYENEYGDWIEDSFNEISSKNRIPGSNEKIKLKHKKTLTKFLQAKKHRNYILKMVSYTAVLIQE